MTTQKILKDWDEKISRLEDENLRLKSALMDIMGIACMAVDPKDFLTIRQIAANQLEVKNT